MLSVMVARGVGKPQKRVESRVLAAAAIYIAGHMKTSKENRKERQLEVDAGLCPATLETLKRE